MRNNNSSEDYLKCILVLKEKNGHVRSVDVAGGYISFSDAGREIAEKVHDKHLLITKVLMRIGVSEQTASKEACMIEHAISDETYRCLQNFHSDFKPQAG